MILLLIISIALYLLIHFDNIVQNVYPTPKIKTQTYKYPIIPYPTKPYSVTIDREYGSQIGGSMSTHSSEIIASKFYPNYI